MVGALGVIIVIGLVSGEVIGDVTGEVRGLEIGELPATALAAKANDSVVVKSINSITPTTGNVLLTSDSIGEGTTNLYYTDARAKSAAVVNSTAGSETDKAASVAAMKSYVTSQGAQAGEEVFTLVAQDITNGYVDLAYVAKTNSIICWPAGGPNQTPTVDYTVSYTGGAGGKTRVTFAGDLLSLVATDKLIVTYLV